MVEPASGGLPGFLRCAGPIGRRGMPTAGDIRVVRVVRVVAVGLVAGLVAACTPTAPEPEPTPSPSPTAEEVVEDRGAHIAVIVPPDSVVAPAEAAALRRAADDLAAAPPDGIAAVRVVEATSEPFVRDLANLAVDDGLELVCVVGTGSAELALELARARREGRFCTTDPRIAGGPVSVGRHRPRRVDRGRRGRDRDRAGTRRAAAEPTARGW